MDGVIQKASIVLLSIEYAKVYYYKYYHKFIMLELCKAGFRIFCYKNKLLHMHSCNVWQEYE